MRKHGKHWQTVDGLAAVQQRLGDAIGIDYAVVVIADQHAHGRIFYDRVQQKLALVNSLPLSTQLFNQLIGMGKMLRMKKLLQAPFTLKKRLLELINRETLTAQAGKPAHIIAKVNSLTDAKVIKAMYKASQSGVKIDLIVRGMCCLRPGIPGVSHNITVRSIIGRFLEHSRVYYFLNEGVEQVWLSSADLMERNLDHRVETCFPLEGKKLVSRAKQELQVFLTDNTQSWLLQPDGTYVRSTPTGNQIPRSAQSTLLEKLSNSPQRTVSV